MRNCMICKRPCVGEYKRRLNAGRCSYCYMEVLEYKRKTKNKEIRRMVKEMNVLISKEEIQEKVKELAERINNDYSSIHLVGLLKGSFVFLADLMREITIPTTVDFMSVRSYEETESTGEIKILKELNESIFDKDVLIVEDIVDTGLTLRSIIDMLLLKHPRSLNIITLLDKKEKREHNIDVKYIGFEIPDKFVVGYGIDYSQSYRQLPYIGTIPYQTKVKKERE